MNRAVLAPTTHIHSVRELGGMDRIVNVGERSKPSNEAVDKFIDVYLEIVKRLEGRRVT